MRRPRWIGLAALWVWAAAALAAAPPSAPGGSAAKADAAAPAAAQEAATPPPRIRQVGPHLYQIGAVVIDAQGRTARCPGRVNMAEGGPIELLACLPRGKVHESVLTLDVEPMDLQLALLLLNMQEGRNPAFRYAEGSPELDRAPGDEAAIFVEWREPPQDGKDAEVKRCRAEALLHNVQTNGPAGEATWVFLGSCIVNKKFGADVDGTLITTFHDPLAILELRLPEVNDDVFYFVDKGRCPAVGTAVDLIIQVLPEPKREPAQEADEAKAHDAKGAGGEATSGG